MTSQPKIALLGCSGWISSYLNLAIRSRTPNTQLIGTYANRPPANGILAKPLANANIDELLSFFSNEKVNGIVNLTRGETDLDFVAHQELIKFSNLKQIPYYYCSSFNACDAKIDNEHHESEKAHAKSDYGKFKAKCEEELLKSCRSI